MGLIDYNNLYIVRAPAVEGCESKKMKEDIFKANN
jgi:hypothetical protein